MLFGLIIGRTLTVIVEEFGVEGEVDRATVTIKIYPFISQVKVDFKESEPWQIKLDFKGGVIESGILK